MFFLSSFVLISGFHAVVLKLVQFIDVPRLNYFVDITLLSGNLISLVLQGSHWKVNPGCFIGILIWFL